MSTSTQTKDERIPVRVDRSTKKLIERAAAFRRLSVSQFIVSTMVEEAQKVIRDQTHFTLSEENWALFMDTVENPPEPNEALMAAFKEYKETQ